MNHRAKGGIWERYYQVIILLPQESMATSAQRHFKMENEYDVADLPFHSLFCSASSHSSFPLSLKYLSE